MKLLERERGADASTPPEPAAETAEGTPPPEAGTRACSRCGARLEPGQDWCLSCGTAVGALGERPGWRAAMTVLGLTLVLVAGAVAAAYAALSDDVPGRSGPVASGPAAQVPPPTTAPAPTTPTTPSDSTGSDGETGTLPKVDPPSGSTSSTPSPRSVAPAPSPSASTPSVTPAPAPSTPADSGSGTGSSGEGESATGTSTGDTPATPATPPAERIELRESAVSVYDPYGRAVATGAPGRAIDGDGGTSWYADVAPGSATIGVGLAIDLGEARGIRRVEVSSPTPGIGVEVYATDEATPPPNILDSRWAHITDQGDVGTSGEPAKIILGAGTSKYRTLLLWITTPPASGTRARLTEVKLFG